MKFAILFLMLLYLPLHYNQLLEPNKRYFGQRLFFPDEDDDDHPEISDNEDYDTNSTEKGMYVGAPCEFTCSAKLHHVYCNPISGECECEKKYPVKLNPFTGCSKPKRLGEQCYYKEACKYTDQHSSCVQIHHNAVCQCDIGYHTVSFQKPSKRIFCAEDLVVMTTDVSTLAGVLSGIAILSGLICFVLHLFNQNLYGGRSRRRRHRFANANLVPPIMFSSDAGSRRPSITSIHSGSSIRSFSARMYEREREQKEEREMQRRLAKFNNNATANCHSRDKVAPSPSPRSTDDLLPTLPEDLPAVPPLATREESSSSFHEEPSIPSTSKQY